jgi:SlyX protein
MDRIEKAEEAIAHLMRTVEDLSAIVAKQADQIDLLAHRVGVLVKREAEREGDGGGAVFTDQRPPHW